MDADVLAFLRKQIPKRSDAQVSETFGPVFLEHAYGPTAPKFEWREEAEKIRRRADAVEADPSAWPQPAQGLPLWINRYFQRKQHRADATTPAADTLRMLARQHEIWHEAHPKTGGTDPSAHLLAQAVKQAFSDLDLPVTRGTEDDGVTPSTRFGRIVQQALKHHGFDCHWRRPAYAATEGKE